MDRLENKLLGIHVGCVCVSLRYFVLFWRAESVLSMVDGGRPKFCHINMSLFFCFGGLNQCYQWWMVEGQNSAI